MLPLLGAFVADSYLGRYRTILLAFVLKGIEIEEETKLAEIDKFQKPLDVPEALFLVLQEVKKNTVLSQSQEQKREALCVIELDERFQGFDELIQRASKVVCGDTQISKDGDFDDLEMKNEKNSYISDASLVKKKKEVNREAGVLGGLPRSSSLKAGLSAGDGMFNISGIEKFKKVMKLGECGLSYAVVSIIGPQSSGKSTLLNHLFLTKFREMDVFKGRSQTTKGIWMAKCADIEPCTLVMDLEGTDGRERGEVVS